MLYCLGVTWAYLWARRDRTTWLMLPAAAAKSHSSRIQSCRLTDDEIQLKNYEGNTYSYPSTSFYDEDW